ncbi:MAG: hypothetical protein ACE5KT_03255, partial [Methanosarcinales archaeon]
EVVSFGSIVQFLADIIRKEKDTRFEFSIPFLPGYLMRCQSCGVLLAIKEDILRFESEKICHVCSKKRDKGRKKRKSMPKEMKPALTIEDIAGIEEGKMGYVAVIYADANNMGKVLFEMNSMLEFAVFSMTVTEVMEKVTKDLVKEYKLSEKYQAPILGGDDILLLVPAKHAPSIVSSLAKKVEEEMMRRGGEIGGNLGNELAKIKMSVGFVIVPAHFNIAFSVDYTEKLLRTAKEKSYESKLPCVDYMVIKDSSPLGLEIKEFRDAVYDWEPDGAKVKLTQKPYLLKDFKNMMRWVKFLRQAKVARSQLKIAESLLKSEPPRVARLNILYEWIRSKEWRDFFKNIRCDDPKQWLDKFVLHEKHPKIYESRFLDVLELYEYEEG